ncbi:MAG: PIG-L deacetylase family protein [Xanthobacteraceae bacterium]
MNVFKRVLVLAPHTDDGELGAGGTIARLYRSGARIMYVAFTGSEESVPSAFDKSVLRTEVLHATAQLGISSDDVKVGFHQVRRLSQVRQEILDELIAIRREFNPDLVFCPSSGDVHQDHAAIHAEALRAFKAVTLLGYELPWNSVGFDGRLFVGLEPADIQAKVRAIQEYKSQAGRPYMSGQFVQSQAISKGVQSGNKYAESFEVLRWHMR